MHLVHPKEADKKVDYTCPYEITPFEPLPEQQETQVQGP